MRIVKPIEVDLDKKRNLLLEIGSLKRAEREFSWAQSYPNHRNIWGIIVEELTAKEMSIQFQSVILWAALLHETPEITVEQSDQLPWPWQEAPQLIAQVVKEIYGRLYSKDEQAELDDQKKTITTSNGTTNSGLSPESSLS